MCAAQFPRLLHDGFVRERGLVPGHVGRSVCASLPVRGEGVNESRAHKRVDFCERPQ